VVEKFATTWTGEAAVPALGETIVTSCAKAIAAAKRNNKDVKVRDNLSKKNPPEWFCMSRTHFYTDPRMRNASGERV
jgi:hypothetical protein